MRIILATCILFGSHFSYSQQAYLSPSQWLETHKKRLNTTPFIIEGTVIKQKQVQQKGGDLYTCSIFSITKIYKGSPKIKLGTIKIFTANGASVEPDGAIVQISDGGEAPPNNAGTYIILGAPTIFNSNDTSAILSMVTDNDLTLYLTDELISFLGKFYKNGQTQIPPSNTGVKWTGTEYKTSSDIDVFFQENGINVQEQVPQADSTKH